MTALEDHVGAVEEQILQLRTEIRAEFFSGVRLEMGALNQETLAHMRLLHEEVLDRIGRLKEGRRGPRN